MLNAGCLFCKIIRSEIPCHKVLETEGILAFLDINPLSKGHLLLIPKYHGEKLHNIPDAYLSELLPSAKKLIPSLFPGEKEDAFQYNLLQNNGKWAHQVRFSSLRMV